MLRSEKSRPCVATRVGWQELRFDAANWIVVDQGNMAQAASVLMEFEAAIGGIHDVMKVRDTTRADQRQRDGSAAGVHHKDIALRSAFHSRKCLDTTCSRPDGLSDPGHCSWCRRHTRWGVLKHLRVVRAWFARGSAASAPWRPRWSWGCWGARSGCGRNTHEF